MQETPGFHHLHLDSVDPDAAIAFYTRLFPTTPAKSSGRRRDLTHAAAVQ